jgi:hypothetical protein
MVAAGGAMHVSSSSAWATNGSRVAKADKTLIYFNAGDPMPARFQQDANAGGSHSLAKPADHATCRKQSKFV